MMLLCALASARNRNTQNLEHDDSSRRAIKTLSPELALELLRRQPGITVSEDGSLTVDDAGGVAEQFERNGRLKDSLDLLIPGLSSKVILRSLGEELAAAQTSPPLKPHAWDGGGEKEKFDEAFQRIARKFLTHQALTDADIAFFEKRMSTSSGATSAELKTLARPKEVLAALKIVKALGWDGEGTGDDKERLAHFSLLASAFHILSGGHRPEWKYDLCSSLGTKWCNHFDVNMHTALAKYEDLYEKLNPSEKKPYPLQREIILSEELQRFDEDARIYARAMKEAATVENIKLGSLRGSARGHNGKTAPEIERDAAHSRMEQVIGRMMARGTDPKIVTSLRTLDAALTKDEATVANDGADAIVTHQRTAAISSVLGLATGGLGGKVLTSAGLKAAAVMGAVGATVGATTDVNRQLMEMNVDGTRKNYNPLQTAGAAGGGFFFGAVAGRFPALGVLAGSAMAYSAGPSVVEHFEKGEYGALFADGVDLFGTNLVVHLAGRASRAKAGSRSQQIKSALGYEPTAAELKIIEDAHVIGRNEPGLNGKPAAKGSYTPEQLQRKFTQATEQFMALALKDIPESARTPELVKEQMNLAIAKTKKLMVTGVLGDEPVAVVDLTPVPDAKEHGGFVGSPETVVAIEKAMGRRPTMEELVALEEAHLVGRGEMGSDGLPAQNGNYTGDQLQLKFNTAVDNLVRLGHSTDDAIALTKSLMQEGYLGDPATVAHLPGQASTVPKSRRTVIPIESPERAKIKNVYDNFASIGKKVARNEALVSEHADEIKLLKARQAAEPSEAPALQQRIDALESDKATVERRIAALTRRQEKAQAKLDPNTLVEYATRDREAFYKETVMVKAESLQMNKNRIAAAEVLAAKEKRLAEMKAQNAPKEHIEAQTEAVELAAKDLEHAEKDFQDNQWHMQLLHTADQLAEAASEGAVILSGIDAENTKSAVGSDFRNYGLGFLVGRTEPHYTIRGADLDGKGVGGYRTPAPKAGAGDLATTILKESPISSGSFTNLLAAPAAKGEFFVRIRQTQVNPKNIAEQITAGGGNGPVKVLVTAEGAVSPTAKKLRVGWKPGFYNSKGEGGGRALAGGGAQTYQIGGGKPIKTKEIWVAKEVDGRTQFVKQDVPEGVEIVSAPFDRNGREVVVALTSNMPIANMRQVDGVEIPYEIRKSMAGHMDKLARYRESVNQAKKDTLTVFDVDYNATPEMVADYRNLVETHTNSAQTAIETLQGLKTQNPDSNFQNVETELARAMGARYAELAGVAPQGETILVDQDSTVRNFLLQNRAAFLDGQEHYLKLLSNNVDFSKAATNPRQFMRTMDLNLSGKVVLVPKVN